MALPVRDQIKYWSLVAAAIGAVLWLLGDVMLPFVLGGALAYCLDPIADWLERHGFSRIMAVIFITFFTVLLFIVLALLVVPQLVEQTVGLFEAIPTITAQLEDRIFARFPDLMEAESPARRALSDLAETLRARGGEFADTLLSSALNFLNVLIIVVLVPVVTFYLLLDWDRMVARIDELLPRDHAPTIRQLAGDIDRTLAAFIRGQGTVCIIMGLYYAIGLMLVGLNFGLVIGATAGLITFIPYVGAVLGGMLALGLALFQFWGDWVWIAAVAAVFFSGQFLEGNIITPNLVGNSVGLHPVWLIFALSAFGTLFGFVGMLVAVPVAAAFGVLARFAISQYQQGRLFRGLEPVGDEDQQD